MSKFSFRKLWDKRIPALFWGDPGIGKTAWVNKETSELGLNLVTILASVREPSDFIGLPVITADGVEFSLPAWAKKSQDRPTVVFFDEISSAAPLVQSALLRIIHERTVGDTYLGDNVYFIAAANDPDIAANGFELAAPLANRFMHLRYVLDHKAWVNKFPTYWDNPPKVGSVPESSWAEKRGLVAAYISTRPTELFNFPKAETNRGQAWPSPRTWDMVSRILADEPNVQETHPYLVGAIGEGAAIEFLNWLKNVDLPDPKYLLKNPDKFEVPKRLDKSFAVLSSVVSYVTNDLTKENRDAAWKILGKVIDSGQADVAAVWAMNFSKIEKDRGNKWGVAKEYIKFQPLILNN